MSDFDPFALNQKKDDTEMPVFESFDIQTAADNKDKSHDEKQPQNDTNSFPQFEAFSTYEADKKSLTSNNPEFPSFDSFDFGPKHDEEMPTFESFSLNDQHLPNHIKPPTFESNDSIPQPNSTDSKSPFYSLAQSIITANSIQQTIPDENNESKSPTKEVEPKSDIPKIDQNPSKGIPEAIFSEKNDQTTLNSFNSENSFQNFPTFGSFNGFDSSNNTNKMPTFSSFAENDQDMTTSKNKTIPSIPEKNNENPQSQNNKKEKLSISASLHSVKSLLKPMPSSSQNKIDFSPESIKVTIPPPKPFKETSLAKEISDYCLKTYNHIYTFAQIDTSDSK